jgi:hypothetical protein
MVKHKIIDIKMFTHNDYFMIGERFYKNDTEYLDHLWKCIKSRYAIVGEKSYYNHRLMREHFMKKGFFNYLEYINDKIEYFDEFDFYDFRNIKNQNLNEKEQKYIANSIIFNFLDKLNPDNETNTGELIKLIYDKVNDNFKKDIIKRINKRSDSKNIFQISGIKESDIISNIPNNSEMNESVIFNLMKSFLLKF